MHGTFRQSEHTLAWGNLMKPIAPRLLAALLAVAALAAPRSAVSQDRSDAWQIATAVLPLPDSMRAAASVLGYHGGKLVRLRAGTNGMTCLADDPAQKRFQASCYHRSLESFMARGRALRAAGVTDRHAIDSARLRDIRARRIVMPRGAMLASVFAEADSVDPSADPGPGMTGLDVIYMPYATRVSTGIPEVPSGKRPWIMYPGKPWAHVMLDR